MSENSSVHERPWLVQKFGGTSVGKLPIEIARDIVCRYEDDNRVVVVCSARSTNIKAEGTTSLLLRAAERALGKGKGYEEDIEAIRKGHIEAADEYIGHAKGKLYLDLVKDINGECDEVLKILEASKILDEISDRTLDLVISAGEKLACLFMTAVIKDAGLDATYVDLSRVIPADLARKDLTREFWTALSEKMAKEVLACGDSVPVVTGFFGLVQGGLINTVGRGYTDLCGALLAVGLEAHELQVWKEVDGIFTADPRKVPTARLLAQITPEEAAELTYYGSEVIHPFTMEQAIRARIPIRIKNVKNPLGNGTRIFPGDNSTPGSETPRHPPIAVTPSFVNLAQAIKGPTAVTSKNDITVLNVHSNRTRRSHGFLALVFKIMDQHKLIVDLISTSEVHISMAIHTLGTDADFTDALAELRKNGTVEVTRNLSIVSLVGTHMKQHIGVAGNMFTTLGDAGINLEMISQGASEINISCVVNERDAVKAVSVLHHRLLGSGRANSGAGIHHR